MDRALQIPGTTNAWTMPIKARIDMLTTGVRTPVGIKIFGADLKEIEAHRPASSRRILRDVPGTRSVFAERAAGGYFVDFDLNRDELARYGLSVAAVQDVIMSAIGGENVTTTIEGRARFPVNVRYPRDLRDDLDRLGRVLVTTPSGAQIPLVAGRGHPHGQGPVDDPQRERPARRATSTSTPRRATSAATSSAPRQAVAQQPHAQARLLAGVERPVREHAARARAAEARRAASPSSRSSSCCT